MKLDKLKQIKDLREIWPNEAKDFTPWLAKEDNLALLSETIGIDIVLEEKESPVGSFSLDIFAKEESTDRTIIIENQLEDTNHDHLGKLITYASGKDASIIICSRLNFGKLAIQTLLQNSILLSVRTIGGKL